MQINERSGAFGGALLAYLVCRTVSWLMLIKERTFNQIYFCVPLENCSDAC
jgi:hypothetical protein